MPNQRCEEYLSSYHFYPNSVEFRIVSSKALEKFKNVQSFQLNQLVNGKFFFKQDRREILLLKYDMWNRWLQEVENFFIQCHETCDRIRQKDIDVVVALAEKTAYLYNKTITDTHDYHFDTEFTAVWFDIHNVAFDELTENLRKLSGTYEEVFVRLVDMMCVGLQYTLIELYELNELFKQKDHSEMFLVVSNYSLAYIANFGYAIEAHRAKYYKERFGVQTVYFKNYTDCNIPLRLIDDVKNVGIEINYEKSLTF